MDNYCILEKAKDEDGKELKAYCYKRFNDAPGAVCATCGWNKKVSDERLEDIRANGFESKYSLWKVGK